MSRHLAVAMAEKEPRKQGRACLEAALKGKDPYGLFKAAITSVPDENATKERPRHRQWQEHRAAYSQAKMLEHHRVGAHFSKMIKARVAAVEALPAELQEEARKPDHTMLPIERRVFTETAPIPEFAEKLTQTRDT